MVDILHLRTMLEHAETEQERRKREIGPFALEQAQKLFEVLAPDVRTVILAEAANAVVRALIRVAQANADRDPTNPHPTAICPKCAREWS